MAASISDRRPSSNNPVIANFDSAHLTVAAGVAIFHLATSRVVVCYHSTERYWFLPKGRRDAGEDSGTGAEREGFEEVIKLPSTRLSIIKLIQLQSGYRNRLLPIPLHHRQPKAHNPSVPATPFVTEPVWTQLMPIARSSQYILFWYIAETLPPDAEVQLSQRSRNKDGAYQMPPPFPRDTTLKDRVTLEQEGYEPVRHPNTGVNEEEALYESYLLPVEEAVHKLRGTVMADVVRKGWEGICARKVVEEQGYDEGRDLAM
ncbi:MAG: hypothetical protein Q9207_007651 [Kuettlingeria erythrocarpa]